jgi:hypothetical protein
METPKDIPFLPSFAPRTAELVRGWREQAARYDRDGLTSAARLLERVADDLAAALRAESDTVVSLADGARLSGYAADSLGRMIRDGRLSNYGRKHAPKVRIGDLPLRPTREGLESSTRHRLAVDGQSGHDDHDTTSQDRAA